MKQSLFCLLLLTSFLAGTLAAQERDVSLKELLPNFLADQRSIWTFPERLDRPHDWVPTVATTAITTGLILGADPPVAHYFFNSAAFGDFNHVFSSVNTSIAPIIAPAGLYVMGLIEKDKKMKDTALFSAEAVADSELVASALKFGTARARPSDKSPNSGFGDSFWEGKSGLSGGFPSGHTIAAMSVATILSRRYGHEHKWVTFVSYGVAAAVGFSRLSLNAHYLSDVFVGGVLGYSISRFTVLRE